MPRAAESCPAGGGGAEAVLLQCHTDARGDGPGVRHLRDGPASAQPPDPGGVCDSASGAPGRTGAALQEEEQAQIHAMHSGVTAALQTGARQHNLNTLQHNKEQHILHEMCTNRQAS